MRFYLPAILFILLLLLPLQVNAGEDTSDSGLEVIVRQRFLYGNNSKSDLEAYLSERGFSRREAAELIKRVSHDLVRDALARDVPKESISKGFRDKGFTPDEIDTILRDVAVEQTSEALSEGFSLDEIQSDLKGKGFTSAEINDVIVEARSKLPKSGGGALFSLLILAVVVFVVILFLVLVFLLRRRSRHVETSPEVGTEAGDELLRLQSEKRDIEEMIRIAKMKFHKRKLDEESFREIVRDHQKKLIEIEARISQIEKRVQKLERG